MIILSDTRPHGFPTKTTQHVSIMRFTCPVLVIHSDLIILIISGEVNRLFMGFFSSLLLHHPL
jgi:hypothetical protein